MFCLIFRISSEAVENQLLTIVRETLEERLKNKIVRNDFLESISQIYKSSNQFEDEFDIVAHAASFFGDGYETSSRVREILITLFKYPEEGLLKALIIKLF